MTVLTGGATVSLGENAARTLLKSLVQFQEYESAADQLQEFLDCNDKQLEDLRECLGPVVDDARGELEGLFDEYELYELFDAFCDIQVSIADGLNGCTSICPLADGFDCSELPPDEVVDEFCEFNSEELCEATFEDAIEEAGNAGETIKYSALLSAAVTIFATCLF